MATRRPESAAPAPRAASGCGTAPPGVARPSTAAAAVRTRSGGGGGAGRLSGAFRHSLADIEAAAVAAMSQQFHQRVVGRCYSAPLRRQERAAEHDPLSAALMLTERARPVTASRAAAAARREAPDSTATRPASAVSSSSTLAAEHQSPHWGPAAPSLLKGRIGASASSSGTTALSRLRGHPGHHETYDEVALAALDNIFVRAASSGCTVRDARDVVHAAIEAAEGAPCSSAKDRFEHFVRGIREKVHPHAGLAAFLESVLGECGRYIRHLERQAEVGATELSQRALVTAAAELNTTQSQLRDALGRASDLEDVCGSLKQKNDAFACTQAQLEKYIDELRVALSTYTSASVPGSDQVTPDEEGSSAYVGAIRRMCAEMEQLRVENARLSEGALQQLDAYEAQSREMAALLDRANDFQHQCGSLKATVRVMKGYIDRMERRMRFLEHVQEDAVAATFAHMADEVKMRRAGEAADAPSFALGELLRLKRVAEVTRPLEVLPSVGPGSPGIPDSLDAPHASLLPLHLRAGSGGDGAAESGLMPRPMNPTDVRLFASDAMATYAAAMSGRQCEGEFIDFAAHLLSHSQRRFPQERTRLATLRMMDLLASRHFSNQRTDLWWYARLSRGATPGSSLIAVPRVMDELRTALRGVPPASKKTRDRIPRAAFLRVVQEVLPGTPQAVLEALALATIAAQEKFSEDVTFEAFFDQATPQAQHVYDQLVRVIITNAAALFADLAEHLIERRRAEVALAAERARAERAALGVSGSDASGGASGGGTHAASLLPVPERAEREAPFMVPLSDFEAAVRAVDPHCRRASMASRLVAAADCPGLWGALQEGSALYHAKMAETFHLEHMLRRVGNRCFMLRARPLADGERDPPERSDEPQ